MLADIGTEKN